MHRWTSINKAVDALSSILFILRPKSSSQKKHLALSLSHITISLVPCTFTFPSNIFPLSRVTNGQTGPNWTSWENVGTSAMRLHKIWNWKLIWTFGFWGLVQKNPLLQRVFLQKHTHTHTRAHTHTHTRTLTSPCIWYGSEGTSEILNKDWNISSWVRVSARRTESSKAALFRWHLDDWCKWLNIGNRNHLVVQLTSARRKVVRNLPSLVHLTPLAFAAKENLRKHCASNQH